MATRKSSRGSRVPAFLLGFLTAVVLAAGAWAYFDRPSQLAGLFHTGPTPEPTKSAPSLHDNNLGPYLLPSSVPQPPFPASEDAFEAGAHVYAARCAACHGTPEHPSRIIAPAHAFWQNGAAIAAEPPGRIYLATRNGVPGASMPAFGQMLSDSELWDVSLLLKNADQPLPDPVASILRTPGGNR